MKKSPVLCLSMLLMACSGQSETTQQADLNTPPKPEFTVKYIDQQIILKDLSLTHAEKEVIKNETHTRYAIQGAGKGSQLDLIGEHEHDLESVKGVCQSKDMSVAWAIEGVCYQTFSKMVANISNHADTLMSYLLEHAKLQPYQAGQSGYAAVQNGRYILELDSEGVFTFRRRRY